MSLLEDITSEVLTPGTRCTIATLLDEMEPADADDLRAAIRNPRIPASAICAALAKRGVELADNTVNRHRRGACKCR